VPSTVVDYVVDCVLHHRASQQILAQLKALATPATPAAVLVRTTPHTTRKYLRALCTPVVYMCTVRRCTCAVASIASIIRKESMCVEICYDICYGALMDMVRPEAPETPVATMGSYP
jgi:hypothetical protein